MPVPRTSAALLLYRRRDALEVLVGHMGGPYWARKEAGAWTIPKGEVLPGEDPHAAAERELAEELGVPAPASSVPDLDLGEVRQRSGKVVHCWAREADLDVTTIAGNTATIEWPPRSGKQIEVPELDRAAWLPLATAAPLLITAQATFLTRLAAEVVA